MRRGSKAAPRPAPVPAAADGDEAPTYVDLYVRNKAERSLTDAPRVLRDALALVRSAGPWLLRAVAVLSLLSAALVLAQILVLRELVETVTTQPDGGGYALVAPLAMLVLLMSLSQLAVALTAQLQTLLSQRALAVAAGQLYDVTSGVPLLAYEDPRFFEHLNRVQQNGVSKPAEVVRGLVALGAGGATAVVLVGYLLTVEPLLVPLLVVAAGPVYLASRQTGRWDFRFAVDHELSFRRRGYLGSLLSSSSAAREVRGFDTGGVFRRRWQRMWDEYLHDYAVHTRRKALVTAAGLMASGLLTVLVGVFLAYRLESGAVPLASAGAAVLALRILVSRGQETARGVAGLLESRLYLQDLSSFRQDYAVEQPATGALAAPAEVVLERAGFRYPGADTDALHDVSLVLRRGEMLALVGENGSGKTTLAMLLAALHVPTSGRVLWNGQELTADDLTSARSHVCIVLQDFMRYELDVTDNIALGHGSDPERVEAAVDHAGAEFLRSLPRGFATILSKQYKGGRSLSVGQWQRLAVARAFYRDSPFIVLDEPTSALDARAEAELFDRLKTLWAGRTVVFVSHRLSSVRNADRVVVLHQGAVSEQGTHDELVAAGGGYAEMYALQARGYAEDRDG
jgi:ATP-binding cassette subfamily B protein